MFTIAIVGRPNVGKSTLFNRLTGTRHALVDNIPGVTRDWRMGSGNIGPMDCMIIDTAGLEEADEDQLEARMLQQTEQALIEADVVLFVIDGRAGITPLDEHFADWLRKKSLPTTLLLNKCEGIYVPDDYAAAFSLGFGNPLCVSAEHGDGIIDLYAALEPDYDKYGEQSTLLDVDSQSRSIDANHDEKPVQVAIIGRPNAGKSTLINALVKKERMLTGPEAGITRDSIAIDWSYGDKKIKLIDTAGIRRKSNVKEKLEKLSLSDCFRAVRYAHVTILLVDATCPLEKQDIAIAQMMIEQGRTVVIGANKWDMIDEDKKHECMNEMIEKVEKMLPQVKGIPIIPLSALHGKKLEKLMDAALDMYKLWNYRISTAKLNQWLKEATEFHMPPLASNKRPIKVKYITQGKTRPPTFMLFINRPKDLPSSYIRFLLNHLRESFNLPGVPVRMLIRKQENPYDKK